MNQGLAAWLFAIVLAFGAEKPGTLLWTFGAGGPIRSTAAIASNGTIYFGAGDRFVYALSPDGKQKWQFKTGHGIVGSPALADDGTV